MNIATKKSVKKIKTVKLVERRISLSNSKNGPNLCATISLTKI
jgi:hypothetical protein